MKAQKQMINKSLLIVLLLFLLLLLLPKITKAQETSCSFVFSNTNQLIQNKFKKIPALGNYIGDLINSETTPKSTKNLIEWFLVQPNIEVKKLIEHQSWKGLNEQGHIAAEVTYYKNFRVSNDSVNRKVEAYKISRFKGGLFSSKDKEYAVIYLSDEVGSREMLFAYFVHELAHVRFDLFLERNIKKLAQQFPEELIQKEGKEYIIDADLYNFLTEKYAYQKEYEVSMRTHHQHFLTSEDFNHSQYKSYIDNIVLHRNYVEDVETISDLKGKTLYSIFRDKLKPSTIKRNLLN